MRRYSPSLGCLWLGLLAGACLALPLPFLVMPGPTDVVTALDYLTRKDSTTAVNVKAGQMVSSGKLLVGQLRVDVHLARSSRNWRGKVSSSLRVPTEIRYAIQLTDVQSSHVRVDANTRTLYVRLPALQVEAVTPLLTEVERQAIYRGARFKLFDSGTSTELQHAMLLHDFQESARKLGKQSAPLLRDVARARLRLLLEILLRPAYPGLTVRVE